MEKSQSSDSQQQSSKRSSKDASSMEDEISSEKEKEKERKFFSNPFSSKPDVPKTLNTLSSRKINPKYLQFKSDLSTAVASFERAQDWADLIHALQRVNRVFLKYQSVSFTSTRSSDSKKESSSSSNDKNSDYYIAIPDHGLLAKRLAQCLQPSLPSGVHLKALETYMFIFDRIGPYRIARDLPLYGVGLFPLFSYAATSLKPNLLTLYEKHILTLKGGCLIPYLEGILLGLVSGLEDETSEFYARTKNLIDGICDGVNSEHAVSSALVRSLLLSPQTRLPTANYLLSFMSKKKSSSEDKGKIYLTNLGGIEGIVSAKAAYEALGDKSILVQRVVLDIVGTHFPLHQVQHNHTELVTIMVEGALLTLLRRDMSLSKRVYSWLLGGKDGADACAFCAQHSKEMILAAVQNLSNKAPLAIEKTKAHDYVNSEDSDSEPISTSNARDEIYHAISNPFKIMESLLDKEEISSILLKDFAIRALKHAKLCISFSLYRREINHLVMNLIKQIGYHLVYDEIESILDNSFASKSLSPEDISLVIFSLNYLQSSDQHTANIRLPRMINKCVTALPDFTQDLGIFRSILEFCIYAGQALGPPQPEIVLKDTGNKLNKRLSSAVVVKELKDNDYNIAMKAVDSFYASAQSLGNFFSNWLDSTVEKSPSHLWTYAKSPGVASELAVTSDEISEGSNEQEEEASATQSNHVPIITAFCVVLCDLVARGLKLDCDYEFAVKATVSCVRAKDDRIILIGIRAFTEISRLLTFVSYKVDQSVHGVILRTWYLLHPSLPTAIPETADLFLGLQKRFRVETKMIMSCGMLATNQAFKMRNLETFACLWRLSSEHRLSHLPNDDCVLLMLDHLVSQDWMATLLSRSWLADALALNPAGVLDPVLKLLLTPETATRGNLHEYMYFYDGERIMYAISVLRNIVESALGRGMGAQGILVLLAKAEPSPNIASLLAKLYGNENIGAAGISLHGFIPSPGYVHILAVMALGFIRARVPSKVELNSTSLSKEIDHDEIEWLEGGIGMMSFAEKHANVSASAAEFFALLISSIPSRTSIAKSMTKVCAKPVLKLLARSVEMNQVVLQMHLLDALEALLAAEGPVFGPLNASSEKVNIEWGAVEASPIFLPTLLRGLAFSSNNVTYMDKNQKLEYLGLRRRWILFAETTISFTGNLLPAVVDGVLATMCRLLIDDRSQGAAAQAESEFERVDERLLLLNGICAISIQTLSLFNSALVAGELANVEDENIHNAVVAQRFAESSYSMKKTSAAYSMMNAINPIKIINDLMRTSTEDDELSKHSDPRRDSARAVFALFPQIVIACIKSWGKARLVLSEEESFGLLKVLVSGNEIDSRGAKKSRRHAQRGAVLRLVELFLGRHPVDVVAAVVALWHIELTKNTESVILDPDGLQSLIESGEYSDDFMSNDCSCALEIFNSIEICTPELVLKALGEVISTAIRWDENSAVAVAGKSRKKRLRGFNLAALLSNNAEGSVSSSQQSLTESKSESRVVAPNPVTMDEISKTLFNAGDFFAECSAFDAVIAALSFGRWYLSSIQNSKSLQPAFPALESICRDIVSSSNVSPSAVLLSLELLGMYSAKLHEQLADKRHRKDFFGVATTVSAACSAMSSSTIDIGDITKLPINEKFSGGQMMVNKKLSKHTTQEFAKNYFRWRSFVALSRSIPVLFNHIFSDDFTLGISSLQNVVTPVYNCLKKTEDGMEKKEVYIKWNQLIGEQGAIFLYECSKYSWGLKAIRKEVVSTVEDSEFFKQKSLRTLSAFAAALNAALSSDKTILSHIGTVNQNTGAMGAMGAMGTGLTAVFSSRDSEMVLRGRAIHRVAFIIAHGKSFSYKNQVPFVLERLRDSIRLNSPLVTKECFLCLRALVLKNGPSSIAAFRASILSELLRILRAPFSDLEESFAALRFLDLLMLMNPADFVHEQCFFFAFTREEAKSKFRAILVQISEQDMNEKKSQDFGESKTKDSMDVDSEEESENEDDGNMENPKSSRSYFQEVDETEVPPKPFRNVLGLTVVGEIVDNLSKEFIITYSRYLQNYVVRSVSKDFIVDVATLEEEIAREFCTEKS